MLKFINITSEDIVKHKSLCREWNFWDYIFLKTAPATVSE